MKVFGLCKRIIEYEVHISSCKTLKVVSIRLSRSMSCVSRSQWHRKDIIIWSQSHLGQPHGIIVIQMTQYLVLTSDRRLTPENFRVDRPYFQLLSVSPNKSCVKRALFRCRNFVQISHFYAIPLFPDEMDGRFSAFKSISVWIGCDHLPWLRNSSAISDSLINHDYRSLLQIHKLSYSSDINW